MFLYIKFLMLKASYLLKHPVYYWNITTYHSMIKRLYLFQIKNTIGTHNILLLNKHYKYA